MTPPYPIPTNDTDAMGVDGLKSFLRQYLKGNQFLDDPNALESYSLDETGVYKSLPCAVVFPESTAEVSSILTYCNDNKIPVTPRGAGTGLAANSVPEEGGLLMILSRMDKILDIDSSNGIVTVQPGCIVDVLKQEVRKKGWFYPVDPASSGTSLIGGHVNTNASGPHTYKYGSTRRYVMALEAVLADGTVIRTGSKTEKNSTGYSLSQLLCGSEGTLAVVTEIALKLVPPPRITSTALVSFTSLEDGLNAILRLRSSSVNIAAMEWMERAAIEIVAQYEGEFGVVLEPQCACRLWIEIEANDAEAMEREMYALGDVLSDVPTLDILVSDEDATQQRIWKIRRVIGHAVRHHSVYREVDTVVPVSSMVGLIRIIKDVGNRMGFRTLCYGHAGNGNLHVNVLREDKNDDQWAKILTDGVETLFTEVIILGGVLSAEHGIGLLNRPFMALQFDEAELALMRRIKTAFDPNGILNPGKVIP